jgi:hypothetical protein
LHLLTATEGLSRMMKAPFVYGSIQNKIEFGFLQVYSENKFEFGFLQVYSENKFD